MYERTFTPTPEQLRLLWHTLGLTPDRREPYRNFFHAGPGHHDNDDLYALKDAGLMKIIPKPGFVETDAVVFAVTETGKSTALTSLPMPKVEKLSKYQEFLDSDCGLTFAEFLGIHPPVLEHQYLSSLMRYVRRKGHYPCDVVSGEWCITKKEAKASYKAALKKSKARD